MYLVLMKKNYILLKVLYPVSEGLDKTFRMCYSSRVPSNRAKTGEAGCWRYVGEGRKAPEDVEPGRARLLGIFYFLCSFSISCGLSVPTKDRFLYSPW
jgi:hypothetical protein